LDDDLPATLHRVRRPGEQRDAEQPDPLRELQQAGVDVLVDLRDRAAELVDDVGAAVQQLEERINDPDRSDASADVDLLVAPGVRDLLLEVVAADQPGEDVPPHRRDPCDVGQPLGQADVLEPVDDAAEVQPFQQPHEHRLDDVRPVGEVVEHILDHRPDLLKQFPEVDVPQRAERRDRRNRRPEGLDERTEGGPNLRDGLDETGREVPPRLLDLLFRLREFGLDLVELLFVGADHVVGDRLLGLLGLLFETRELLVHHLGGFLGDLLSLVGEAVEVLLDFLLPFLDLLAHLPHPLGDPVGDRVDDPGFRVVDEVLARPLEVLLHVVPEEERPLEPGGEPGRLLFGLLDVLLELLSDGAELLVQNRLDVFLHRVEGVRHPALRLVVDLVDAREHLLADGFVLALCVALVGRDRLDLTLPLLIQCLGPLLDQLRLFFLGAGQLLRFLLAELRFRPVGILLDFGGALALLAEFVVWGRRDVRLVVRLVLQGLVDVGFDLVHRLFEVLLAPSLRASGRASVRIRRYLGAGFGLVQRDVLPLVGRLRRPLLGLLDDAALRRLLLRGDLLLHLAFEFVEAAVVAERLQVLDGVRRGVVDPRLERARERTLVEIRCGALLLVQNRQVLGLVLAVVLLGRFLGGVARVVGEVGGFCLPTPVLADVLADGTVDAPIDPRQHLRERRIVRGRVTARLRYLPQVRHCSPAGTEGSDAASSRFSRAGRFPLPLWRLGPRRFFLRQRPAGALLARDLCLRRRLLRLLGPHVVFRGGRHLALRLRQVRLGTAPLRDFELLAWEYQVRLVPHDVPVLLPEGLPVVDPVLGGDPGERLPLRNLVDCRHATAAGTHPLSVGRLGTRGSLDRRRVSVASVGDRRTGREPLDVDLRAVPVNRPIPVVVGHRRSSLHGLPLQLRVRVDNQPRVGLREHADVPCRLLAGVGQLVGQHLVPLLGAGLVLALVERDVVADRERAGVDRVRRHRGVRPGVDLDVAEVATHLRFHLLPDALVQRLSRRGHDVPHGFGRTRPGLTAFPAALSTIAVPRAASRGSASGAARLLRRPVGLLFAERLHVPWLPHRLHGHPLIDPAGHPFTPVFGFEALESLCFTLVDVDVVPRRHLRSLPLGAVADELFLAARPTRTFGFSRVLLCFRSLVARSVLRLTPGRLFPHRWNSFGC